MNELILFLKIVITGTGGIICYYIAYKIFRGDSGEYMKNRNKNKTWYAPIVGRLSAFTPDGRDYRVAAGIALNLRNRQWECQGALSDEAIDSMLKR